MNLCEKHLAERNRWLDHRTKYRGFAPYATSEDQRVRGYLEGYTREAAKYRQLVLIQLALIDSSCLKHQGQVS